MFGTDNTYNAEARFTCTQGFDMKGSRIRRCEHSGRWSGDDVTCTQVDCGQPGPFYNGFLDGGATVYGSEYKFRCFGWTTFEGESLYTTCQENGLWSHPVPKCWARCTYPTVVNGTVLRNTDDDYGTHGEELNVTCADGHSLNTTEPAKCHNGTWTFVPECVPASCQERPHEIRFGYVRFYTMNHRDKAKYKCNTGYKLHGDRYVTCEYGEWRGNLPECIIDYCDHPGHIANGVILLVGMIGKYEYRHYVRRIEHNQEIEYQCGSDYRRVGPAAATCVDGEWSPKALPECVPKQHPKILYLFRGKRSVGRIPRSIMDHGTEARKTEAQNRQGWDDVALLTENGIDTVPDNLQLNHEKGLCEVPEIPLAVSSSLPASYFVPDSSLLEITCPDGYSVSPPGGPARCDDGVWTENLHCQPDDLDDVQDADMDNEDILESLARHPESGTSEFKFPKPHRNKNNMDETEKELLSMRHMNRHAQKSQGS